jgi:hypothetical protein
MDVKAILTKAFSLFDGGKKWIKGTERRDDKFCSIGAINHVLYNEALTDAERNLVRNLLGAVSQKVNGGDVVGVNDNPDTKFETVARLFDSAIKAAEELEIAEKKVGFQDMAEVARLAEAKKKAYYEYNAACLASEDAVSKLKGRPSLVTKKAIELAGL